MVLLQASSCLLFSLLLASPVNLVSRLVTMTSTQVNGTVPTTPRPSHTSIHPYQELTSGSNPASSQGDTPRNWPTSPSSPPVVQSNSKPLRRTFDTLRSARHFFTLAPEELSDAVLEHAALDPERIQITSSWGNYLPRSRYDPPEPK